MSTRFEKEKMSTKKEKWKWIHTQHEPNSTNTSLYPYLTLTLIRKGSIFGYTTRTWRRTSSVWITQWGEKKREEEEVSMETTNNDMFPSQSFLQKTLLPSIYKLYIKNKVGTTWKVSNWTTSYFSFSYLIQRRNYWKESD